MVRELARPRGARTVDELLAHDQIYAVLTGYCQGVDRKDWDLVLSCYHDDAVDDHAQTRGTPREFVEWMKPNHEFVLTSMHVLTNVSIRISDEDPRFARVETYFLSQKTVTSAKDDTFFKDVGGDEPLRRTVAGRYVDTFENREGVGWRIAQRVLAIEWVRQEPNDNYFSMEEGMSKARRDEQDPLYDALFSSGE